MKSKLISEQLDVMVLHFFEASSNLARELIEARQCSSGAGEGGRGAWSY